jgi:hypothetical protein
LTGEENRACTPNLQKLGSGFFGIQVRSRTPIRYHRKIRTLEELREMGRRRTRNFRMRKRIAAGKNPMPMSRREAAKIGTAAYSAQRAAYHAAVRAQQQTQNETPIACKAAESAEPPPEVPLR